MRTYQTILLACTALLLSNTLRAEATHFKCKSNEAITALGGKLFSHKGAFGFGGNVEFTVEKRTGKISRTLEFYPDNATKTVTNWALRPQTGGNTWSYRAMSILDFEENFSVLYLKIDDISLYPKSPYPFTLTYRETIWAGSCE